MENKNDIIDTVNQLSIQLTIMSAKCFVLEDMLLGLVMDKMPDQYPEVYTKYVDELEHITTDRMNHLDEVLLGSEDHLAAFRAKFSAHEMFQAMKMADSYLSDTGAAPSTPRKP